MANELYQLYITYNSLQYANSSECVYVKCIDRFTTDRLTCLKHNAVFNNYYQR